MKRHISNTIKGVVGVAASLTLCGCAAEAPFEGEGVGTVYLRAVINSVTTRADGDAVESSDDQLLKDKFVLNIRRANGNENDGLIYQKQGLGNIEAEKFITLKPGHYVAEGWTGEYSYASFDKKYYEAEEYEFDVAAGGVTTVNLNCKIQNSVVYVNAESIDADLMRNYSIKVENSKRGLVFDESNVNTAYGYFMMPEGDTELLCTISGYRKDDTQFTMNYKIEDVKPAYRYKLSFKYNPPVEEGVGSLDSSFIKIEVDEETVDTNEEVSLVNTNPVITGVGYDIADTMAFTSDDEIPEDLAVMICTVGEANGQYEVKISGDDFAGISYVLTNESDAESCMNLGIEWLDARYDPDSKVSTAFILLKKSFITSLHSGSHTIAIEAKDASGKSSTRTLSILRSSN